MDSYPDQSPRLKRLLRCKRHEQPPPGFFLDFSDKVIARIEAAQRAPRLTWWQRLWAEIDPKPVLVSSYGVAVCAFMLFGLSLSQSTSEDHSAAANPSVTSLMTVTSMPGVSEHGPETEANPRSLEFSRPASHSRISSMNPVISTGSPTAVIDRFDHSRSRIQRVNFTSR